MKIHTAIFIPLKTELKKIKHFIEQSGYAATSVNTGKIEVYIFRSLKILLCKGGHGKVNFAITAQHIIEKFPDINFLIGAGTSGRLTPLVKSGDIVICTETIEHDYKMKFIKQPLPKNTSCIKTLNVLKNSLILADKEFSVYFAPIASGDEDIVDEIRRSQLYKDTNAYCVAWEGAGLAKAAAFNNIPFIEIRSISDNADNNSIKDFMKNLTLAMQNISQIIVEIQRLRLNQ